MALDLYRKKRDFKTTNRSDDEKRRL